MALASARPFEDAEYRSSVASAALRGLAEDVADLQRRLCERHAVEPLDYLVLRALGDMPGASADELASYAHASRAGLDAAAGRLHGAGLARMRSKDPDRLTGAGRLVVATIEGSVETALESILGGLEFLERQRLALIAEGCRCAVWEAGAAPVVAVLEPAS